ncbi:hypothetical protein [Nocardia lasii]|uniref:Uncharacterized protein n=1 Tax=Nocardia lasii TaxID=1616107 RepID=A0ABW1JRQ1_9NOCA
MTTSGTPAPGMRISLPSGAVWEGGTGGGTATITLPEEDTVLLDKDGRIPPNALIGSGLFGVLDSVLSDVLGTGPGTIAERVAGQAMDLLRPDADATDTKTRLIKFSSKTTLLNPAKPESGVENVVSENISAPAGYAAGGAVRGPGTGSSDSILARLSNGEFVVNAAATAGALPLLEAINAGWVPSAGYLAGMLPGFANGGLVGDSGMGDPQKWREMLGTGLIADVLGSIGGAAVDAAGTAGAALGGALAPVLSAGGPFGRRTTEPVQVDLGANSPFPTDGPPITAALNVEPQGLMGAMPAFAQESTSTAKGSAAPLSALSEALSAGIVASATEAGGQVGAALGAAIAPALGPAGQLAPEIGEQLGQTIGSRFGGGFAASMSLKSAIGTMPSDPTLSDGVSGGKVAPGGAAPTLSTSSGGGGSDGGSNSIVVSGGSSGGGSNVVYLSGGTGGTVDLGPATTPRTPSLSEGLQGTSLAEPEHRTTYGGADYIDRGSIVGSELAKNFGESLGLSDTTALRDVGSTVGALAGALGIPAVSNALSVDGELAKQLGIESNTEFLVPYEQQKAFDYDEGSGLQAGVQGFLTGTSSGGLVKGLTGAAKGAAQDLAGQVGGFLGAGLGTAIAGPAGAAIGGVLGSFAGSTVMGKAVDLVAKPIEWAASTAKELVGTGFGLTDLAEGVGGHTARGDIFNFNGMDPTSVAMSIARVQRRKTVAQQRGGVG